MRSILLEEVKNVLRAEMKTPLGKGAVTGVTTDSRAVQPGDLFFALRGDHFDGHDFIDEVVARGAVAVVIDRKMPMSETVRNSTVSVMRVDDAVEALGVLAGFYRSKLVGSVAVIGVTGTNGKTTVREMIYHVLSKSRKVHRSPKNYNNQIGVPLTLFGIESDHQVAVVEIGTNAPGEIAPLARMAGIDVAVITHVGPSHLEGLVDVMGVSEEKVSIVTGLKGRGAIVCGVDHKPTLDKLAAMGRHVITFGLDDSCDVSAREVERVDGHYRVMTNDRCELTIPMAGLHNVKNALAALAVVRRLGVSSQAFAEAIKDFKPVAGRMVYREVNGITIIDDTYNANPVSMRSAIDELMSNDQAERRVLAFGDMGELGPDAIEIHQQFGREIAAMNVDLLLAVGPLAAHTAKAALDAGIGWSNVQKSVNSRRLARLAKSLVRNGDIILVKGSRAMAMEKVVESLERWKGRC
ncbi:MAG: UDP-N-acetylmuramoyl-tripeptide--D-alanyl-D-alanine ligase [Phycisphaerae bacterium]|nr:UDP-N-acetylmuramoyl-tripeptide--D-alanyl-D-alanine ligase [Phycisphaerae bacterium]